MLPVLAAYCGVVWTFNAGNVTVSGKNKLSACFRLLLVLAGSAAIVCVLASPHMFLFFREWFDHLVFQRRQWLEPANAQASGKLLQQWLHEFRLAFGAALMVLVVPGFLLVVIRRSLLPAAAFVGVCIYAVQMQGLLVARYLIVAIPVLIFCVASGFGAGRIVPRVAAQSLPVIVLLLNSVDLYCGYCSRLGVDTRQACATYLSSLAGGQVIWFSRLTPAITVDTWKFPRVAESHMTVTDSFEKAELLCISDYEWNTMMRALDSPLLGPGDRWPVEQALVWREREIPPPEYFRLFRSLRDGSSDLRLIAEFRREFLFEPEFSDPGLRIFHRRSGQLTEDSLGSRGFQKSNGEVCCSSVRMDLKAF